MYYARNLTAEDEMKLRTIWSASNASHDNSSWLIRSFFAAAYIPAIWKVTRQVSPFNALAFTGVYYGFHWFVQEVNTIMLQRSLNAAAQPFAGKYDVVHYE